jgi:DNA repair photolyase
VALEPRLGIQTKSDLILRDVDVLSRFRDCEAGLTITTLDDRVRQEIEPGAAPIARRIAALAELKAKGLRTYVFVGPILPGVTDWRRIVEETAPFADFWYFENLNVRGQIVRAFALGFSAASRAIGPLWACIYPGSPYWDEMAIEIRVFAQTLP